MSRHRHIRNMRYEDYKDDDYYSFSEEEEEEEESSPYLYKNNTPTTPEPDTLLSDLTIQFRQALSDETLQQSEIDAAIISTNYDVDAALTLLRTNRLHQTAQAAHQASNLELRTPSPIAALLHDSDPDETPPPNLPSSSPSTLHPVTVHSGPALPPQPFSPILPFRFDHPSPDDVIRAKQAGLARRKPRLRMPKASALGGAARPAARPRTSSERGDASNASASREATVAREISVPEEIPAAKLALAPVQKVVKQRLKKLDLRGRVKTGCSSISVVVAGHVDAGKSTLLGHLLRLVGGADCGNGRRRRKEVDLAWGTDEDGVERERGVTIDIATRVFENKGRRYAMIDAPGHRDFVPAMILGATQASAALLVVDASPGEFEAGFKEDGQTREHALVLKAFGVGRLVVVVNKMDVAGYEKERFGEVSALLDTFLRKNGWKGKNVVYVPASGREGVNLVARPKGGHALMRWYQGKTVLEAIEELPGSNAEMIAEVSGKPTRLIVSDFFKSASLGGDRSVTGRLLCGSIAPKDKLVICPGGTVATVKNIQVGTGEKSSVVVAGVDSLPVSMGLMDLTDGLLIAPGSVLCDPEAPVQNVVQFRAQLVTVTTSTPLIQGTRSVLHVGGGTEAASITRLCEYVFSKKDAAKSTNKKRRPRRLVKGDTAIVEITCDRPVAMEKAEDLKALGRFALRQNGRTVGVGIVVDILTTKTFATDEEGPTN